MASRGWQDVTPGDITRRELKQALKPKGSKYRNVKIVHDGITFDSKREADRYVDLRVLVAAGEIRHLRCHVHFELMAPLRGDPRGGFMVVAEYVADFVYDTPLMPGDPDLWRTVVEDTKGMRTAMYKLKKKWLELQEGIVIREI